MVVIAAAGYARQDGVELGGKVCDLADPPARDGGKAAVAGAAVDAIRDGGGNTARAVLAAAVEVVDAALGARLRRAGQRQQQEHAGRELVFAHEVAIWATDVHGAPSGCVLGFGRVRGPGQVLNSDWRNGAVLALEWRTS